MGKQRLTSPGKASSEDRFLIGKDRPGTIIVAVAVYRTPNAKTIMAVQDLINRYHSAYPDDDVIYKMDTGSDISAARNGTIAAARQIDDLKGVLFVDDDMVFQVTTDFDPLSRLISRDKPIVGALCTSHGMPLFLNAANKTPDGLWAMIDDMNIGDPRTGKLARLDYLGFGLMYVSARAIETMTYHFKEAPLFNEEVFWRTSDLALPITPDHIDRMIREAPRMKEDFAFCHKAGLAGLEVWADTTFMVDHVGDYPYNRWDWAAAKEEAERQNAEKSNA